MLDSGYARETLKRMIPPLIILAAVVLTVALYGFAGTGVETAITDGDGVLSRVLVIDAGHGGGDGGASSGAGLMESELNLDIALRLKALAELLGARYVMTRESEDISYPGGTNTIRARKIYDQKRRLELINGIENAVLISIHQNKFPDSRPRGPQALYAKTEGSKELGELTHDMLIRSLYPESRRVAAPISDSIYLLKNIKCPAILVECGFLSNPGDESLLREEKYRVKLAAVLICSFLKYVNGEPEVFGSS